MKRFFKKYLSNNCTEEEFKTFVSLFKSPEHKTILDENMREDWHRNSSKIKSPDLIPTLHKIHYEINKREAGFSNQRKIFTLLTRIAAILFIPLAIAFIINIQKDYSKVEMQTISTPMASKTTFELPDGSKVWLNSGSSLTFPKNFNGKKRMIKLDGEAYFDVIKNKKPFEVETSNFSVRVLGTAFNVMAYRNEVPEVTLERGKIAIRTSSNKEQSLSPGQQAVIDTLHHFITVNPVESELFTSWKNNKLIFRDETLANVIKRLERWYNITISLKDNELASKKMTATIEYETISEVMELLEITLPLQFEYNKDLRNLTIIKHEQNK